MPPNRFTRADKTELLDWLNADDRLADQILDSIVEWCKEENIDRHDVTIKLRIVED